ncbi:MAG: hypothetical protein WAN86_07235 [Hyphomicrobiaceae bacterium]
MRKSLCKDVITNSERSGRTETIPIHPPASVDGPYPSREVLQEEFLRPLGISQNQLAREIDVPASCVAGIIKGNRAITPIQRCG